MTKVHWTPTEKQAEALSSNCFETLYGGARGGGKTDAGMAWLLYDIGNPQLRALVVRRNATDLSDWIDRAKEMYRPAGAEVTHSPLKISFPSGAIIRLGHLKDDNAFEKYQGHEYQRILIEELTQIPREKMYMKLLSSCRSTVKGLDAQIFATTNPGNRGHEWVKRRFVDPARPGTPFGDEKTGRSRVFIPARVDDNPHIMENDPDYVRYLDGLPEDLRKQWRDGSWDHVKIEGSIYGEHLGRAIHEGRIGKFKAIPTLKTFTSWDLGQRDFTSIGIWQISGNSVYLVDGIEASYKEPQFFANWLKEKGLVYEAHYLPHDVAKTEQGTGKSIREVYESFGIRPIRPVPRLSTEEGITAAKMLFPRIYINEDLDHVIASLKHYRREWDEKKNTFKADPYHDWSSHTADMIRYFAVGHEPEIDKQMRRSVRRNINPN